MQNGRVSITAKDATLRQILTEWARVGQTKIVNVERISSDERTRALEIQQVRTIQEAEIEAQKAVEAARIARERTLAAERIALARHH